MQAACALAFTPPYIPLVTPSKTLSTSPLRFISTLKAHTCPPIKAATVSYDTSTADYSSMTSVFPAEACEIIGGEACDVEMYPESKLKSSPTSTRRTTTLESVDREYLAYNEPKTVFLGEACDDLGREFCEAEYQTGVY
ncbi:light-regulated protein, chloroplastic [Lycium ferocissimum]|uniref:light-regulated protein, chloroplastic n=1 Tax=Lycium ferocissimum TaxID=112874 RepID=UPI002815C43C|nr:light-regulated protein, chloroplastic [Lycium ferocissimum]